MITIEIIKDENVCDSDLIERAETLESLLTDAGNAVLECDAFVYPVFVSLMLTDDSGIHQVNKDMRNVDRPTDVLSFPLINFNCLDKTQFRPKKSQYDIETGAVALGDIVISVNKALSQSQEFGHSFERELVYLFVHSMSHLLGYDHMVEEDKKIMRALEERAMEKINLLR